MKTHSINKRYTKDFLNNEVKDFALSVIKNRSLPCIMDGMRSGARKIVWAAITKSFKSSNTEKVKMVNLIGDTMNLEYHHGDSSLKSTIEALSSKHSFKYCPFEVIGQMATLRNPETDTAARYLGVRKRQYLDWYKTDKELLTYNMEEGNKVEPKMLLPIIPIVLLWRTNSPGFGYSFRSFSFDLNDVIDATLQSVITGTCSGLNEVRLKPEVDGIDPKTIIYNESKQCWYNVGKYEIDGDILQITDLPYSISLEKYNNHLQTLQDKLYIHSFEDLSCNGKINIKVRFAKNRIDYLMNNGKFKFFTNLKLFVKLPNLTLNTIDIDNKSIVQFDTPNDLVDGFVRRRISVYNDRKVLLVKTLTEQLVDLKDLAKFIRLVVDNKIIVSNRKKVDIKADCDKYEVSYRGLDLKISKLTEDEINDINMEIESITNRLDYINNTTVKQMYVNDLIDFKIAYGKQIINHANK